MNIYQKCEAGNLEKNLLITCYMAFNVLGQKKKHAPTIMCSYEIKGDLFDFYSKETLCSTFGTI